MKETGINYFYTRLGLPTGAFGQMFTFEENAGSVVNSISGAQPQFPGVTSNTTTFWSSPGSGFFNGTVTVATPTASGLDSATWTKIFVYEKASVDDCVLFNSLTGTSGYRIGITRANKPYFESVNVEPITAASLNNFSSKNVVAFSYLPNLINIGLFNFNSQQMETESFSYPFSLNRSDSWTLGGSGRFYLDYALHFTQFLSSDVISQLCSGFYARPTGIGFLTTTICTTGITGTQNVFVGLTGVTGYLTLPNGDEGQGFYTGAFPLFHTEVTLTGYLSSGMASVPLSGVTCYTVTGAQIDLLEYLTGYSATFNMQKTQLFSYVDSPDIVKVSADYTPFNDIYNRAGLRNYSGYQLDASYTTGQIDLFYNGLAQANSGWSVSGTYLIIDGTTSIDIATFDVKLGQKRTANATGSLVTFALPYSGQEIYLNGINLISGRDFTFAGNNIILTSFNTGISGVLSEYPVILTPQTGQSTVYASSFQRNTSNVYFNGLRQQNRIDYVEGATYDLLSGNTYSLSGLTILYSNTDLYWET